MNATALYVARAVLPAAFSLLPPQMATPQAAAMLLAIGLQESGFNVRRQYAGGPARGWWQFELAGTVGALEHPASRVSAQGVLAVLGYAPASPKDVHAALEHNDILAAAIARLYLWTDSGLLPQSPADASDGWLQYQRTWRPGKPRPETWDAHFTAGWAFDWPSPVRAWT